MNQYAQGLAALGRGPDSMLVHMSPREVQGLQTLAMKHGGSLTINPHTGLPEAGFLDSILPMVAAGATAYFTGGTALPMLAGAGVGALTNKQSPLMGALLGGLSGYGFGGLGETFGKMGAEELAKQTAMKQAEETAARQLIENPDMFQAFSQPVAPIDLGYSSAATSTAATPEPLSYAVTPSAPTQADILSGARQAAGKPVEFLTDKSDKYLNARNTAAAAAPLLSYGIGSLAQQPTLAGGITNGNSRGNIRPYTYAPGSVNPRFGQPGEPYFRDQGFTAGPVYAAAEGGAVPSDLNTRYPQSNINQSAYATASQSPMSQSVVSGGYSPKLDPFSGEMQMAGGGIAGTYAAGGRLLRGDGDGVSDSIPAEIHSRHGVQKAALADGEFVLPARIVSEIGNGSTEAGARKLYAMMDRIQKRRGKTLKNVAANTKAERLLPA